MRIDRRTLVGGGLFSLAALNTRGALAQPPAATERATPVFPTREPGRVLDLIVGLRPSRADGVRLEVMRQGAKTLVHNYGHSGGGITLAPGCAEWVASALRRGGVVPGPAAVLGAGMVGLTTAAALRKAGYQVTVYSALVPTDKDYENVTSAIAGGQFAPSMAKFSGGQNVDAVLRASAAEYKAAPAGWGVKRIDNFTLHESSELAPATRAIDERPERMARLPFAGLERQAGYRYPTLLIETPLYLRSLHASLLRPSEGRPPVTFVTRTLAGPNVVSSLTQPVVVNCLGLGGGLISGQRDVWAAPGLLVRLPPQEKLDYLYSGVGYVFPRSDVLIIGGTVNFPEPGKARNGKHDNQEDGWKLVESARSVFRGNCPAPVPGMSGASRREANVRACRPARDA